MHFVTVMITCPEREEVCRRTLNNLQRVNWPFAPIICTDQGRAERKQDRQEQNALRAMQVAIDCDPEFILFLEDDLEFNEYLYTNLARWSPLYEKPFGMGSLYNPNIRELERNDAERWFIAKPEAIYGSQAFIFAPECARYIVEHWSEVIGMQDIKMSRLAARHGLPIYYHTPSLVQHVGEVSTFGGGFHQTQDFNRTFAI